MARRDPELTKKVRDRIRKWDDNWRFNKRQYHEFMSFVMGNQWTEDESKLFEDYKKIPLTFNKLAPLINHLLGDQRQHTPNLQVVPGKQVDVETASIREALIKDISLSSHAKVVYQTAFQCAAIGGFGAYAIDTDYESNSSFHQEPRFVTLHDPTVCYWDIGAKSPCKTDGMFAGYRTRMTRKRFAALFGKALERKIGSDANYDEGSATGWIFSNDDEITVIHDYERIYQTGKLYYLSNEEAVNDEEFKALPKYDLDDSQLIDYFGEYVTVVETREVPKYKIKARLIAGEYELESTDFPSEQLPVVFVDQNSYWDKSGKQICRPFVKDAKDAQRYLNYLGTQSAYLLKVSRYDQYIVSKQNVKSPDTQQIWRDPSTAHGGLVFDESPTGVVPIPVRPPELSNSLITQYQRALMDIQSSTGMYDSQMGEEDNAISGKAVDARTKRGNKNTYVPFDSLNRAIAVGGEIINEMIPKIYDTKRQVMLNLPDQGLSPVMLNEPVDDYGVAIKNDMTKGEYKIRLLPGPSFEDQKQENLQSMQAVLAANPRLFELIADLYVENLPMENNLEMRNRLRTIVDPAIIEAGKTGKPIQREPQQPPPEIMLKQQELAQKYQIAMQETQLHLKELAQKQQELELKAMETKQDISMAWKKLETERLEAAAKLQEQELRYQAELHRTNADMQISHADNLVKLLTSQPHEVRTTV